MNHPDGSRKRPEPDHEAIEALLAADPRCEKDDSPDDQPESSTRVTPDELERLLEANPRFHKVQSNEGETTVTFLGPGAAERLKKQQEEDGADD